MTRKNDLGSDPVPKLILRLCIPTMLAQLVSVLYAIVDRMYIGAGVGDLALAGVGVCGPIVTFLGSFAALVGLGGSPNLAMRMGEGNREAAQRILNNAFLMLLCLAGILTGIFLATKDALILWFGASPATFDFANQYLTIYTLGTVFALLATGMNSFLICQGFSGLGMATVMLGAVLNIGLDPVFIFLLDLGVAGAAVATVIAQAASCAFVLLALRSKRMHVRLGWGGFQWATVWRIARFGLSPFLIIASDSVILIVLNATIQHYGGPERGDFLVTCATIVQSYFLLVTMPLGGLTAGAQPVVSFNYGAGKRARIIQAVRATAGLCLGFCALMLAVTHTLSPLFVRLFTDSADVGQSSVGFLKIFTAMILPLAVQYTLVDETIAMGHVRLALFCSMFRKCSFLACVLVLPRLFGVEAVFFAEPVVDLAAACLTCVLFFRLVPPRLNRRAQLAGEPVS